MHLDGLKVTPCMHFLAVKEGRRNSYYSKSLHRRFSLKGHYQDYLNLILPLSLSLFSFL